MAKAIDESLQRQLSKKMVHFLKYFPVRIKNVGEDAVAARNLIWAFKDSRDDAYEKVAQMTADHLQEEFSEQVSNMVFVCVPASTQEQNQSRYERFCERVSELTGIANGFTHVRVLSDRLAIHEHRHDKSVSRAQVIDFDAEYFNGKNVLVMDDVVTTGASYALFANQLETFGANVLGGFFLGRTSYKYKQ
jgi:predicted amidophosphoribosyltransferase